MCTRTHLALLLTHADRTLKHKPWSATEGQRVALMNVDTRTEFRGDSINSGHIWPDKRYGPTYSPIVVTVLVLYTIVLLKMH